MSQEKKKPLEGKELADFVDHKLTQLSVKELLYREGVSTHGTQLLRGYSSESGSSVREATESALQDLAQTAYGSECNYVANIQIQPSAQGEVVCYGTGITFSKSNPT